MPGPTSITIKFELRNGGPHQLERRQSELEPESAVVAVMLAVENDSPSGQVQLGGLRWRFANRVEMLEAIDAACEEATRISEPPPVGDRR